MLSLLQSHLMLRSLGTNACCALALSGLDLSNPTSLRFDFGYFFSRIRFEHASRPARRRRAREPSSCPGLVWGAKATSFYFVEQNSGLVIEQIRFSELAAKKVVICIVAAAFVIREGNPHSPLLARYDLGELLRVRARIRRDRLHEVLGDAHALLGDLQVLVVPLRAISSLSSYGARSPISTDLAT